MEFFDKTLLPDISQAATSETELNKLLSYPRVSECIEFMFANMDKPKVTIDIKSLAVNGEVVQDEMVTYLNKKAVSSSALKEVLKTPLHYYHYVNQTFPRKEEKYFELGTFAHLAFLEPTLFDKVVVEPTCNMASTAGCLALVKFYEELNKVYISSDCSTWKLPAIKEYIDRLKSECLFTVIKEEHKIIIDMLRKNYQQYGGGIIPQILKGARNEVSFYTTDEITGLPCKVRPDAINIKENIGVDAVISFKTTSAHDLRKFVYDTGKLSYEISEGFYQEIISKVTGREFKTTIMIMLQTVPPYLPAVFWWDSEDLEVGKYKFRYAIDTIKDCIARDVYPGYDAEAESGNYGIINMKQPPWVSRELHPVDLES